MIDRIRRGARPAALFAAGWVVVGLGLLLFERPPLLIALLSPPLTFVLFFLLGLLPYLVGGHIDDDGNLVGLRRWAWGFIAALILATIGIVLWMP